MGKFDKYFITDTNWTEPYLGKYVKDETVTQVAHRFSIDAEEFSPVPGAFHFMSHIVIKPTVPEMAKGKPHCHDFDEYMIFASIDPQDIRNLGGKVEFWMEGEKHIITQSTAVFIPKFTMHLPMNVRKVNKPFILISTAPTLKYNHFKYSQDPQFARGSVMDETAGILLGGKKYEVTRSYLDYLEYMMERNRKERGLKY